jgi:hypothetical protein
MTLEESQDLWAEIESMCLNDKLTRLHMLAASILNTGGGQDAGRSSSVVGDSIVCFARGRLRDALDGAYQGMIEMDEALAMEGGEPASK